MSVVECYDPVAVDYCRQTLFVDRREVRARFSKYLPRQALIFDAGCGSGADTKAFMELGYPVLALDGSKEMVKFAASYTGEPVVHLTFEEMDFEDRFDAIWSSYSLVHYSPLELHAIIPKFLRSLKDGGYWYMSFLYGLNARQNAPIPSYHKTEAVLRSQLAPFSELQEKELWITSGIRRDGKATDFLHCIVQKSTLN